MPGRNPDASKIYGQAWVYAAVGSAPRPVLPLTAEDPMTLWTDLGLLDGDKGFEESREVDSKKFYGWGHGKFKTTKKNHDVSGKFTMFQEEEAEQFVWPDSTATKRRLPKSVLTWLCFETLDDAGILKREFTTMRSEIWVPSNNRNESDPSQWEIQYELFADSNGDLFDVQVST